LRTGGLALKAAVGKRNSTTKVKQLFKNLLSIPPRIFVLIGSNIFFEEKRYKNVFVAFEHFLT
jgi:hypothetical protein